MRRPRVAAKPVEALQIFELLIFAVLAVVVLFQLYTVLGRRVGRQPEDARPGRMLPRLMRRGVDNPPPEGARDVQQVAGLASLKARDGAFDPARFLQGARTAFETIVKAFTSGDRATLQKMTSADVLQAFETAMVERETADRTQTMEFLQPVRADMEAIEVEKDVAQVKVRFLAEFRTRTKDAAGEAVDDRRTAEVWTFERSLTSRDPNWTLARVDAAAA